MLKNLKNLRKENAMSQKQVAEILHISQQTYSDYENCKTEPTSETLIEIAKLFDVSIDELLGREERAVKPIETVKRPQSPAPYNGYEASDVQTRNLFKLFEYMTVVQRAQVYGYAVGLLEQSGVNVQSILA